MKLNVSLREKNAHIGSLMLYSAAALYTPLCEMPFFKLLSL